MDNLTSEAVRAASDAAYWAAVAALAAWLFGLVGLIFNATALYFVFRQLAATETAANAAWMTSRPWLGFELNPQASVVTMTQSTGLKITLTLEIIVTNIGTAPALDIEIRAGAVSGSEWKGPDFPSSTEIAGPYLLGALTPDRNGQNLMSVPWEAEWGDDMVLAVSCEYSVPGLSERRRTVKLYVVGYARIGPTGNSYDGQTFYQRLPAQVDKTDQYRDFMT